MLGASNFSQPSPPGTVMTPNYQRSMGISPSPWCDCSSSGNNRAECDKFSDLFTINRCLRTSRCISLRLTAPYFPFLYQPPVVRAVVSFLMPPFSQGRRVNTGVAHNTNCGSAPTMTPLWKGSISSKPRLALFTRRFTDNKEFVFFFTVFSLTTASSGHNYLDWFRRELGLNLGLTIQWTEWIGMLAKRTNNTFSILSKILQSITSNTYNNKNINIVIVSTSEGPVGWLVLVGWSRCLKLLNCCLKRYNLSE